ncbi:hypothetical protein [Alienimonas californiensis]|uniref:Cytidylyltransferase family protein n=1 Tax=Alienimonas californiensis TaxID=2527989 RepID=A0A517PFN4_9PLAN|nr:hypothetical protein [Alienimonas californiensis]QDT18168.1 Cytidylyltransferase family protein [Alienimonas californiensis]
MTVAETPGRLSPAEWRRRALHMSPGLLPVILWFVPHRVPISPILRGILLAAFAALTATAWFRWREVRRSDGEDASFNGRFASVFGYAGGVLLTLFAFPDRPECGFAVLGVLAFGDGSATLFGKLAAGSRWHARLPWNREKSWVGLIAFVLCGTTGAALLYRGESLNLEAVTPPASWGVAFLVGLSGALPAGLWESARSRINDNVRVALAAALGVLTAHAVRVGGF